MSDRISPAEVAHVARLARLQLTETSSTCYTDQLGDDARPLRGHRRPDLDDVAPINQPYPLSNVLRDDVVGPVLDRDEVLAAAPAAEDGRSGCRPILGEAP